MGIFSGCLFASDIDGTLTESGYINPRNIEKIEYFVKEGGMFSLSTGRTAGAVSPITDAIKNIAPSVVGNGCMIYDFKNSKVLDQVFLPETVFDILNKVLTLRPDIGIEAHSGITVIDVNSTNETRDHQIYEKMNVVKVDFEKLKEYPMNKILFAFSNEEERIKAKDVIGTSAEGITFLDTVAEVNGRLRYYYELLPKGVSKALALDKLRKMFKISNGCLFAMGDYYNDLEMIKNADVSAATADSPEDIKSCADFVSGSCRDGAVADFIDYLTKLRKGMD